MSIKRTRRRDTALPSALAHSVLDSAEANVFVADLDFTLIYANRCALRTAALIEPELKAAFRIGVADLLFGSIHRFHRDPARVERILRDPKNFPHSATFQFGDVTLATNINAVTDPDGNILAYCVAWDDITSRRKIEQTAGDVAAELATASRHLNDLAAVLGQQADLASEQAESVATAAEQMSASISEISNQTSSVVSVAAHAVESADAASATIARLSESSQQIGEIVKLIGGVAAQTNLLALNATIESARAGEAGRGFAVVASEVKQLAKETAAETEKISAIIAALQADSQQANASITAVATLIATINDNQGSIAGAVEEQSATTNEISRSVATVSHTATNTTEAVASLTAAAAIVASKADDLRRLVTDHAD